MWNPQRACLPTHKTLPGVSLIRSVRESYCSWVSFDWTLQVMEFLRCALLVLLLNSRLHTLTRLDCLSHSRSRHAGLLCLWYLSWISTGSGKGSESSFSNTLSSGPSLLIFNTLLRTTKFLCRINYVRWHLLYLRWKLNFKGKIRSTAGMWSHQCCEYHMPEFLINSTAHLRKNERIKN